MTQAPIHIIEEGWVTQRDPGPMHVATGPRLALRDDGVLVCSLMVQSQLAINNFQPMLARSTDHGRTWSEPTPIWPDIVDRFSIFGSISRSRDGDLYFFGSRYVIDEPGETLWSDATQGLKQNELIWSRSRDGGQTWSALAVIPMALSGSSEAAGTMCSTHSGRLLCCYAPYNTFDPGVAVDRSQVALMFSDDAGTSWTYTPMLRFDDAETSAAETWVVELADGRILGAAWHLNMRSGTDMPNAYAVSSDGGTTWSPTRSTGLAGQALSLTPLPDGDVLLTHNRRKVATPGIWLNRIAVGADDVTVQWQHELWHVQTGDTGVRRSRRLVALLVRRADGCIGGR